MVRMTKTALHEAGWDALVQRLGVAGALRFFMESGLGKGDYTKKHQEWAAKISRKELFALVEKARRERRLELKQGSEGQARRNARP